MLEVHVFEGKNENEVMEKCLGSLMVTEDELYKREEKTEGSLFKSKKYKIKNKKTKKKKKNNKK